MKSLWHQEQAVSVALPGANPTAWAVPVRPGLTFLKLRLRRGDELVSDNFYWLEPGDDFKALAKLPPATVALKIGSAGANGSIPVTVTNQGSGPALLVRLRLIDAPTGVETLPAAWTDNYLNLLPGEKVEVHLHDIPAGLPQHPALEVSGYNVPAAVVTFEPRASAP
jgi:hypothetical protein